MQQNRDINTIQTYIHSLQSKQNERILLVNTHHAALDALLNQKALVAKNRKIDIQFSVNDLSPIKIDMVDLTVVISNTLDNAIEACEKLPETDRQIYVQALLEEDELFYAVRNKSLPVNMIYKSTAGINQGKSIFSWVWFCKMYILHWKSTTRFTLWIMKTAGSNLQQSCRIL